MSVATCFSGKFNKGIQLQKWQTFFTEKRQQSNEKDYTENNNLVKNDDIKNDYKK